MVPFIIREQPFNVQGVFLRKSQLMVTGQGNLFLCHSLDLSVSSQRSNIIGYWKEEKQTSNEQCRRWMTAWTGQKLQPINLGSACGQGGSKSRLRDCKHFADHCFLPIAEPKILQTLWILPYWCLFSNSWLILCVCVLFLFSLFCLTRFP